MEFDEQTRQVIAQAIRERRAVLGLSQEQAAAASGGMISTANLRVFEGAGRTTFRDKSLIGVARAMSWPADAIMRIAAGADPRALPTVGGEQREEPSTRPAAGGIELATSADVAHLRNELEIQRGAIAELSRQVASLVEAAAARRSPDRLAAAHSGDVADAEPSGPRTPTRPRVEAFAPEAD